MINPNSIGKHCRKQRRTWSFTPAKNQLGIVGLPKLNLLEPTHTLRDAGRYYGIYQYQPVAMANG
jgi:hypothetical protein